MKKISKGIGLIIAAFVIGIAGSVYAFSPSQNCTSGQFFNSVSSTGNFGCGTPSGGGSATTTINGASAQFNFTTSTASNSYTIATSTSGGSSTIKFTLPSNVGFFTNDSGYLTSAVTTLNSISGATILSAGAGISIASSSQTITVTNTGVTSFNTQTGAATYVVSCTSGCSVATTTTSTALTITPGLSTTTPFTAKYLSEASTSNSITNSPIYSPSASDTSIGTTTDLGLFDITNASNTNEFQVASTTNNTNSLTVLTANGSSSLTIASSGLITLASPSTTIRIGVASLFPGCIELYDAANSSTINYIYSSSTSLIDTASKPNFCQ